eukprot:10566385-Alexandrium_andersonii.AAC.1
MVGHMCCFGARPSGPACAGVRGLLVRKPTRWASSAPEVLKRVGIRRTSAANLRVRRRRPSRP